MKTGKKGEDYPAWGNNDVYKKTISGDIYSQESRLEKHTMRVAKTVARRLYRAGNGRYFLRNIFGTAGYAWLRRSLANTGHRSRFCLLVAFGIDVADSIQDIGQKT